MNEVPNQKNMQNKLDDYNSNSNTININTNTTAIRNTNGLESGQQESNENVSEFQDSLFKLQSITKSVKAKQELEGVKNTQQVSENQKLYSAQKQIDASRAEQNQRRKQELMIKSSGAAIVNAQNSNGFLKSGSDTPGAVGMAQKNQNKSTGVGIKIQDDDHLSPNSYTRQSSPNQKLQISKTPKSSLISKIKNIITIEKLKKVAPVQPKLTQEEIIKKYQKAFMIIKTIVRLNKISENIRNYGTSSNLFDVATRDRPTVKKVLFPLTTLNEEQEEQELAESLPLPLIHPESKINKYWNPVYMFLMLYTATVMPYRIAFDEDEISLGWTIIDWMTDGLFWIDLCINMFTAYYNEDGQLVKTRKKVVGNYLKSWFLIDFLACFPFEMVIKSAIGSGNSGEADSIKLIKLARIPRMYRLVRITKVVKLFKVFDRNSFLDFLQFNSGILRLITLFMTVLFLVHLMGCFWYYLAKLNDFEEDTWVARSGMINESQYSMYIASIYYAFTALTTVGYGDITARTNIEMIITMFWMVFGVGFYSFTIGILSSVLAHMDTKSTNLQKKISIMNEFCNEMKISKDLKQKLRKALSFNSDKNCFSWADQQNIFRQLPINLRYEICMNIHQGIMKTFNFFTMEDDKYFVTRVVPILKPLHMEEGEILWQEGWNPESLYLLATGRINFMSNTISEEINEKERISKFQKPKSVRFKSMINGSYFGEIDIIKNRKRQFNAACDSECELYYLPRFEYENIIKRDFPHIDEKLRQIAEERDKKNDEALQAIKRILKDTKAQTEEQINEQLRKENTQKRIIGRLSVSQKNSNNNGGINDIKSHIAKLNIKQNNNNSQNDHVIEEQQDEESKIEDHGHHVNFNHVSYNNTKNSNKKSNFGTSNSNSHNKVQQQLNISNQNYHEKPIKHNNNLDCQTDKISNNTNSQSSSCSSSDSGSDDENSSSSSLNSSQNSKQKNKKNNKNNSDSGISDSGEEGSLSQNSSNLSNLSENNSDDSGQDEQKLIGDDKNNKVQKLKLKQGQKNIKSVKNELAKYQKKASIIEQKFDDLEKSLESTLQQLKQLNQ